MLLSVKKIVFFSHDAYAHSEPLSPRFARGGYSGIDFFEVSERNERKFFGSDKRPVVCEGAPVSSIDYLERKTQLS